MISVGFIGRFFCDGHGDSSESLGGRIEGHAKVDDMGDAVGGSTVPTGGTGPNCLRE